MYSCQQLLHTGGIGISFCQGCSFWFSPLLNSYKKNSFSSPHLHQLIPFSRKPFAAQFEPPPAVISSGSINQFMNPVSNIKFSQI
jgi:hypothetical protein